MRKSIKKGKFHQMKYKILTKERKSRSIVIEFKTTDVEESLGEVNQILGMKIFLNW